MLFVFLFVAFIAYIVLYFAWETAQPYLDAPAPAQTFLDALFMPDHLVFTLLRGLILITFLYLIGDYLLSFNKRRSRRRAQDKQDASAEAAQQNP